MAVFTLQRKTLKHSWQATELQALVRLTWVLARPFRASPTAKTTLSGLPAGILKCH